MANISSLVWHLKSSFTQTLSDYHLIGEIMENAILCCLFHQITLSTLQDTLQNHGDKFQTVRFLRAQYANLFMTSLQVKEK
jgi:chromosome condensin MukBEF complex kleisin-like MukF subunit